jgi:hypothetical protein
VTTAVDYLPVWKKNATAGERLRELALIADKHPERFQKWVIVYCEDSDKRFKTEWMNGEGTRTSDCLAVLTAGIQMVWSDSIR